LIPANLLSDPNANIEKLVEENYDYFFNLLGKVACSIGDLGLHF
jgi:hypothetical protein